VSDGSTKLGAQRGSYLTSGGLKASIFLSYFHAFWVWDIVGLEQYIASDIFSLNFCLLLKKQLK